MVQRYNAGCGSTERIEFGIELSVGLRRFKETKPLEPDVTRITDRLAAAKEERARLRRPFLEARADLRGVTQETAALVRSLARAVEIQDGGRRGRLFEALYPDGVGAVLAPRHPFATCEALLRRIAETTVDGIEPIRAAWAGRLSEQLGCLADARAVRDHARASLEAALGVERALRNEHLFEVERVMDLVRAAFPRDRERQEAVFPPPRRGRRRRGDVDDGVDEDPADQPVTG